MFEFNVVSAEWQARRSASIEWNERKHLDKYWWWNSGKETSHDGRSDLWESLPKRSSNSPAIRIERIQSTLNQSSDIPRLIWREDGRWMSTRHRETPTFLGMITIAFVPGRRPCDYVSFEFQLPERTAVLIWPELSVANGPSIDEETVQRSDHLSKVERKRVTNNGSIMFELIDFRWCEYFSCRSFPLASLSIDRCHVNYLEKKNQNRTSRKTIDERLHRHLSSRFSIQYSLWSPDLYRESIMFVVAWDRCDKQEIRHFDHSQYIEEKGIDRFHRNDQQDRSSGLLARRVFSLLDFYSVNRHQW